LKSKAPDRSVREWLRDSAAHRSTELEAARKEWEHVRELVANLCDLPEEERKQRLADLKRSGHPLAERVERLVSLAAAAAGFLEGASVVPEAGVGSTSIYQAGDAVGPYTVIGLLGQGGMGQVYLAEDTRLLREVAIKVVREDLADRTLLREARIAASLQHEGIVAVYDVLEEHGRLHIVMERLEGRSLASLAQSSPLPIDDVASFVRQVLVAVEYAHAHGVLHCDLKPGNVVVLPNGRVKVLDFGLARFDVHGAAQSSYVFGGTPRFMAPERLLGAPPSRRTDVYSLGVMLADLIRGPNVSPPATDDAETFLPERESRGTPLHNALLAVAAKATAAEPDARYASAARMLEALETALRGGRPVDAQAPRPRLAFLAPVTLLVGLTAGALTFLAYPRGPVEKPVIAIEMSPIGGDPLAGHIAAALEQLVERALVSSSIVVARKVSPPVASSESGATHVLSATVQRMAEEIETALSIRTADNVVLASETTRASLGEPQALAKAVMTGTDLVLRRADLPAPQAAFDLEDVGNVLSTDPQAFGEYAQACEYLRTPEVAGNADLAIGLLRRALDRDPTFALAHASLAQAYWAKYRATRDNTWTDRARAAALEALRLNRDDPAVRYTLAWIYRGMGRTQEAIAEVSKALTLDPANDEMYRLRGILYADLGQIDQALENFETARSLRPGYFENHRATGLALFGEGRYDEAVPYFQRVAELRPSNASAYQNLGTALHAAGRVSEALEAYQKALSIAPNANTYANIGKIHYDSGRYEEARQAYEQSLAIQPREAVTHRNLGDTLRKLGQGARARHAYETAIQLAAAALEVNPSDLAALSLQAVCHAKLGQHDDAVLLASKVLAHDRLALTVRYRAGVALVLSGRQDQGVAQVVRAIDEGFSRSEASMDDDLSAVAEDPRLRAALESGS
jgi:serine/threonine protein kinase/predicted TPR repeat methyltransferase